LCPDGNPCELLERDYPNNGNPRLPTQDEWNACCTFLPQLFGEVLAAISSPQIKLRSAPQAHHGAIGKLSFIGFGVVGLQVRLNQ
jgi:hypothetical protein